MPIDALKGKELNLLVDCYLKDGIDREANLDVQLEELMYIFSMQLLHEVRVNIVEASRLYSMRTTVTELIEMQECA